MDKRALECYAMIGSKEPIIEWLKSEGVKTKEEARVKLESISSGIALSTLLSGSKSASTFSSANSFLGRIVETFE